jgi:hypothetical protein
MAVGSPTPAESARILLVGYCLDCRKKHAYDCSPHDWLTRMGEWRNKHLGHRIEFRSPERRVRNLPRATERTFEDANAAPWWVANPNFRDNADVKLAYGSSAAFAFGFESTATSATYVAGRESTAVSNTTNLYLDYMIGGKATTGTTPTAARVILIRVYGSLNDTPLYADVLDGTDSTETFTSADIMLAATRPLLQTGTSNTSDRTYWMGPTSLAEAFGWLLPKTFGLYGTHDTGANLNATAGNHAFYHTGVYGTVS